MNKTVMRLWILMLMGFSGAASAAEVTLSCTPPTHNEDGSPITGAITYTAHYGATETTLSETANLGSTCGGRITIQDPPPGQSMTRYFAVRAHVGGAQSDLSEIVSKTIAAPPPIPNPPTGLTVQEGEQTAYQVIGTKNRFTLLPVGTVAADTACDASQSVNGYYVVPREAVTWFGSVEPQAVVARCSG